MSLEMVNRLLQTFLARSYPRESKQKLAKQAYHIYQ